MEYTRRDHLVVLIGCSVATLMMPLMSTMMNLSLVNIGQEFGVGSHDLGYVNTAYILASVVFMVPFARLGDIIGKKKLLFIGTSIVVLSCLLAPLSPSFWAFIGIRALTGAGASAIAVTTMSIVVDVMPPQKRGFAMGVQTTFVYFGLAIGPVIGGVLNDLIGWRYLLLLIVPIGVIAMVLLSMFKHEIMPGKGEGFDLRGTVLYAVGIGLTMMGVINLPEIWAAVMAVVGMVFLILFCKSQNDERRRILDLTMFRDRQFLGASLATFLNYAASYSISFFIALYLQSIGGLSSSEAGILMIVQPGVQALLTSYFGRLSDKVSNKRLLPTVGMLLIAAGVAMYVFLDLQTPLAYVIGSMLLVGLGFAMFSAPNTAMIMSSVEPRKTGEASGIVSLMRQAGMMVSMGLAMVVISIMMGSMDNLTPENYPLFIDVIRVSFAICLVMCLTGAGLSSIKARKD